MRQAVEALQLSSLGQAKGEHRIVRIPFPRGVQWIAILLTLAWWCGPAHARSCTPVPSGIVGWWPGDVNESDIVGSNNPSAVHQYGSVILLQNVGETASAYDVIALDWSYSTSLFNFTFGEEDSETIFSKDTYPPGFFYLVAVTYDGTTFRLYVNGVLQASRRSIEGGPGSGFRQWNGRACKHPRSRL
jgi:hypothetical protein